MLLGTEIVARGIVPGLAADDPRVQPNGVDLCVGGVWRLEGAGRLGVSNGQRVLPERREIAWNEDGWVHLASGAYGLRYAELVHIPLDCGALVFPRSSLLRMGAHVPTAVWDAGYNGRGETLLEVWNAAGVWLERGARISQMVVWPLSGESVGYGGRYQGENP